MCMTALPAESLIPALTPTVEAASQKLSAPKDLELRKEYEGMTGYIYLSWKKVRDADGYQVYIYDTAKKKYVPFKKVKGTTAIFKDYDSDCEYRFKVAAYKKGATGTKIGKLSEAVICRPEEVEEVPILVDGTNDPTLMPKPTGLMAAKIEETRITLKWDPVPGASSYKVEYYCDRHKRQAEADTAKSIGLEFVYLWFDAYSDTNSVTIGNLDPGTKYVFIVCGVKKENGEEIQGNWTKETAYTTRGSAE